MISRAKGALAQRICKENIYLIRKEEQYVKLVKDLFANDKYICELLILGYKDGFARQLWRRTHYKWPDWGYLDEYSKKLTDAYGCTERVATEIVNFWLNLLNRQDVYHYIIPEKYISFSGRNVNEENFHYLMEELKEIENRYLDKINIEDRYEITDWESELCYEQGKYMEFVRWTGKPIDTCPKIAIPYVTYSKMNEDQLKYYIYWRTCFRDGTLINTGYRTIYYLCVYELLAEFGDYTTRERLDQLESLYKNRDDLELTNAFWVGSYARLHGLEIMDPDVKKMSEWWEGKSPSYNQMMVVVNGDADKIVEAMISKSAWKLKNSSFMKKVDCRDHITNVLRNALPEFKELFKRNGLNFYDFLLGRVKKVSWYGWPYSGSVWNSCVIRKIGFTGEPGESYQWVYPQDNKIYITDAEGNIKRQTSTARHYADPYLSEYIVKLAEMLFRKELGYDVISMPQKLIGALKMKFADGNEYVLAVDPKSQERQKKYISLYDDITHIVEQATEDYFSNNREEIDILKHHFKEGRAPHAESSTAVEEMISFINSANDDADQMDELMRRYNACTPTVRKTQYKRLRNWIWDFWILHENTITYDELENQVVRNGWFLHEKKAILERDYFAALPYLNNIHDVQHGVVARQVKESEIRDCIILLYKALDALFATYNIDSAEIILGEWDRYTWPIYETEVMLENTCREKVRKNISDLEIYEFEPDNNTATVWRHSYDVSAETFNNMILKMLDNRLREHIGYKNKLQVETPLNTLFTMPGYEDVCNMISRVIYLIVESVVDSGMEKEPQQMNHDIWIKNDTKRMYEFDGAGYISDLMEAESFVGEIIYDYYLGVSS